MCFCILKFQNLARKIDLVNRRWVLYSRAYGIFYQSIGNEQIQKSLYARLKQYFNIFIFILQLRSLESFLDLFTQLFTFVIHWPILQLNKTQSLHAGVLEKGTDAVNWANEVLFLLFANVEPFILRIFFLQRNVNATKLTEEPGIFCNSI